MQVSTALKLLYRARYLALLVCGENHPELALIDSNIGLILHAVGEYDISLRYHEKPSFIGDLDLTDENEYVFC